MAEKSFIQRVSENLERLITLQVITSVGDVSVSQTGGDTGPANIVVTNDKAIVSRFNLVQGDIRTDFDQSLTTDDYQWLRDFHKAQEEKGMERIKQNIAIVQDLIDLIRGNDLDEGDDSNTNNNTAGSPPVV